jgi:hypothetical protein
MIDFSNSEGSFVSIPVKRIESSSAISKINIARQNRNELAHMGIAGETYCRLTKHTSIVHQLLDNSFWATI